MIKVTIVLVIGILIGVDIAMYANHFNGKEQTKYIELNKDFVLHNGSVLKQGTLLRVDECMSEGFTRYQLYVNYKGNNAINSKVMLKKDLKSPYWMYLNDSSNLKAK